MVRSIHINSKNSLDTHHGIFKISRKWIGRLFSTIRSVSNRLFCLIFKTDLSTKKIFTHNQSNNTELNTKKINNGTILPQDPDPVDHNSEVILDSADEDNISKPIVEHIFQTLNLTVIDHKIPNGCQIYNLEGEIQTGKELSTLQGDFQLEWNLEESKNILIYKGKVHNGLFHGKGWLFIQDKFGFLKTFLDGSFENGLFVSGLLANDNTYIVGTFINGNYDGTGTIHFLKDETLYQGEFANGNPNGHGKIFNLFDNCLNTTSVGRFQNGKFIEGNITQTDGDTYKGKCIDNHVFEGSVQNLKQNYLFEGKIVDHEYLNGQLITKKEIDASENNGSSKKIYAIITQKGDFNKNTLYSGNETVEWPNYKATTEIREGKRGITEIRSADRIFRGTFDQATVNGEGNIYNLDGEQLYFGEIKNGIPKE